ncbi:MAG: hypothetical protein CMJ83_10045 [Planctomycetes bacterium]|nr:hypothetical protein [Planctomycetota bacterium]
MERNLTRTTRRLGVAACLMALALAAPAQEKETQKNHFRPGDPLDNPSTPEKTELGRFLFESPLLSRNRKIACSTCHDPDASFADGMAESRGIFETEVGKNSPTLWGIALHPGFLGNVPDHNDPKFRGRKKLPKAEHLSLEQRCLTPIENPIEMGNTVKEVVRTLKVVPGLRQRFDDAFGKKGVGISPDRIGKAIACFLRAVEVPDTNFRRFVEGDESALSESELRGLALFKGPGSCTECHSGPYLSDGRIHQVAPLDGFRARQAQAKARKRLMELQAKAEEERKQKRRSKHNPLTPGTAKRGQRVGDIVKAKPHQLPAGYGRQTQRAQGAQTPTLWDIARTAPYFRDGTVDNLEIAVRQHVSELKRAGTTRVCGNQTVINPILAQLPKRLKPTWGTVADAPKPSNLNDEQFADLMAFLGALSPRPPSR